MCDARFYRTKPSGAQVYTKSNPNPAVEVAPKAMPDLMGKGLASKAGKALQKRK